MKKHIITVLMSVLVFTHSVMASPDTVNSEAVYNFEIKADVVEYPINWLKENNKINVPLYFTNNPGFNEISFLLEADEQIEYKLTAEANIEYMNNGLLNYFYDGYPDLTWARNPFSKYYCDHNGEIGCIWIKVPQDSKVGDFYEVKFPTECTMSEKDIYFTKDGEFFGAENMSFVNGGVRIVEERPFYQGTYIEPSPEPEQKPDVPAGESQQDNVSENKNQSSENEQAVNHEKKEDSDIKEDSGKKEVSGSQSESVSSTTGVSADETKVTTVSGTATAASEHVTGVTTEFDDSVSTFTSEETSTEKFEKQTEKKKKNVALYIILPAAAVAVITIYLLIRRRRIKK